MQKRSLWVRLYCAMTAAAIITTCMLGSGSYAMAATTDTVVELLNNTPLPSNGATWNTVLSLTLKGSTTQPVKYVLSAYGDLVNFSSATDFARCRILVNTTQVAFVSTYVGIGAGSDQLSTFASAGGVTVPTGTTSQNALLQCEHDNTNGATPYVDAFAS